ncbi:hypothetical protein C1I97_01110 [Streptomyces sp. NTH33]|uniref:Rv1733c family protein n=1 Tax=Streptomyces sp. NTH33 TaxID=1735453 RepID=UPI000DA96E7F|nr:hypothetical protein [Streptomyces sp. NTH33]PZH20794.1 hypothetical protein C1I97_01110 [Streptomyces sp. NTH33]
MSGKRSTKQRLWRWRSNPLRRHDDVVEAWIVLVMWVVILVGGALMWTVTARAAGQEFAWQRADRHAVPAALLTDAPQSTSTGSDGYRALAKVRWTAPDGTTRTAHTLVPSGLRSGTAVTVWQNGRGALSTEPPGPAEAGVEAVFFGGAAAVGFSGLAYGTAALARWRLDRRRYDQWGAEWDAVGPRWDQKTG